MEIPGQISAEIDSLMCETIGFLEPGDGSVRFHRLMDANLCRQTDVVPPLFPGYLELLRQDLCAELTTLNHYGLGGLGSALVDGLFALAVQSRRVARAIGGSVAT
jgi:hypothetical protein